MKKYVTVPLPCVRNCQLVPTFANILSILFSYLISLHLNCNHPIVISSLLDESSPLALQEINVGVSAKTQDIASMYCDVAARPMFGNAREWSLSSVFCPRNRTVSDLKENRI